MTKHSILVPYALMRKNERHSNGSGALPSSLQTNHDKQGSLQMEERSVSENVLDNTLPPEPKLVPQSQVDKIIKHQDISGCSSTTWWKKRHRRELEKLNLNSNNKRSAMKILPREMDANIYLPTSAGKI